MAEFAIKQLEFQKVKEMLAYKAATFLGKKAALDLEIKTNYGKVKGLLSETDEALRLMQEGERVPLGGAKNILESLKRSKLGSVLESKDFLEILDTVIAIRRMKKFLNDKEESCPNLAFYQEQLLEFSKLEKKIEMTISEKGEIKDSASVKLAGLRRAIVVSQERIKKQLDVVLHSEEYKKYFQDNLVTMRADRYVIPIKQEYKFNFPGVIHDQSSSGATIFIEPLSVVNLNNDIKKYKLKVQEEQERILRELSNLVGNEAKDITSSLSSFTRLDVIFAKAKLALDFKATRPMMSLRGKIEIHQGRHPLIDLNVVVPLDIYLGEKFNTLIITGPNTGGKTVSLKVVGLFSIMAQCGLFLPAKMVKLPVVSGVYVDIGDEQSIEQSLSTFSSHMKNIIHILKTAQAGDLVLIDEICAGTDPNEGSALAMSILRQLHKKKINSIITTHYSELKTFAYETEGMENASVEFDPETLQPTYKLIMGVPGSSNALYIARRLGLSEDIIENATNLVSEEHIHIENVLKNLEDERKKFEVQNKEIEQLVIKNRDNKKLLDEKTKDLEKKKKEILHKAREEANYIYRSSKREADDIIKDLKKLKEDIDIKNAKKIAQDAKKKLSKSYEVENDYSDKGNKINKDDLAVGQNVFLKSLGQKGKVLEIDGSNIKVQVGLMKTIVPIESCLLVNNFGSEKKDIQPKVRKKYFKSIIEKKENITSEIDIRGLTVLEAIPMVEKYIDNALLTNQGRIRVIHGKGTGMLRKGMQDYFRSQKSIKRFEFAPSNEGGEGATIVYL